MYSQYRSVGADQCLVLPDDARSAEGASAFVNPMTALGMIDTRRREGHSAIVHTAAASNLGQILLRLCAAEKIDLVNIVRSDDQESLLRGMGVTYVCNARSPRFIEGLTESIAAAGATIAFDAIGGGPLAGQILRAMEAAASRNARAYSRYGSTVHKQVYLYGGSILGPRSLLATTAWLGALEAGWL
jgi:NADPH2:quinone reductase